MFDLEGPMQEGQCLLMPLSAMDIASVQRSIVALKRHEWFRVYGGVMPAAVNVTWLRYHSS